MANLEAVSALVVESDNSRAKKIAALLQATDELSVSCVFAHSLSIAQATMTEKSVDIVFTGLELSDARGLDSLVAFNESRSSVPVVVVAEGNEPDAVLDAARSLSDDCLFWEGLCEQDMVQSLRYAIERQKLLEELRSKRMQNGPQQEFFRGIVERIDEAIFVVARDSGSLLYANETAKRWYGANMGEALEDVLEYDLLEADEVEMEISSRHASVTRVELRSLSAKWGDISACMISMRDLSKQKRAEEAFLACQRRLDYSIRESGFWWWNLTNDDISFSKSFRNCLGYEDWEYQNSVASFEESLHPEDREETLARFRSFGELPIVDFEIKFRIRASDGLYLQALTKGGLVSNATSGSVVYAGSLIRTSVSRERFDFEPQLEESGVVADPLGDSSLNPSDTPDHGVALIVDDEEVLRKALESILSSYGFETIVASDGQEGISLYESHHDRVKIIILDMNMPRVDGGKVFQRIREDGDRIPIIMTSGNDDKQALPFVEGEDKNCEFLLKPFGLAEVKEIVERYLAASKVPAKPASTAGTS